MRLYCVYTKRNYSNHIDILFMSTSTRVYIVVIKANCHEMFRLALIRHNLARRQRKRGLLTQLVHIIACCASLSPIIQAEEMFGNCADIQTVPARQFYESCRGSVWLGSVCLGSARV